MTHSHMIVTMHSSSLFDDEDRQIMIYTYKTMMRVSIYPKYSPDLPAAREDFGSG